MEIEVGLFETFDRLGDWRQPTLAKCVLCKEEEEDPAQLFFNCNYNKEVWNQVLHVMGNPLKAFTQQNFLVSDITDEIEGMTKGSPIWGLF